MSELNTNQMQQYILIMLGVLALALTVLLVLHQLLTGSYYTARRLANELNERVKLNYPNYTVMQLRDDYQNLLIEVFPTTHYQIVWHQQSRQFIVVKVKLTKL